MELSPEAAQEMSRGEALRTLATAEGVPAHDRRMALIMLAGPEITPADEARAVRPRLPVMAASVGVALQRIGELARQDRQAMRDEFAELGL